MKEPFCYYWGTTLDDIPGNYRETCPVPDLGWHGCDGCEMICTEEEYKKDMEEIEKKTKAKYKNSTDAS